MNQLIKNLFYLLDTRQSEAEAQASQAAKEAVQVAEERLTNREFEDLWDAIVAIERASEEDSFALGFRLGVQLTLEGLRPVCTTDQAAPAACPYPPR